MRSTRSPTGVSGDGNREALGCHVTTSETAAWLALFKDPDRPRPRRVRLETSDAHAGPPCRTARPRRPHREHLCPAPTRVKDATQTRTPTPTSQTFRVTKRVRLADVLPSSRIRMPCAADLHKPRPL